MSRPLVGRLTISLSAVVENWQHLRSQLRSGRCGAVVKADAYGLGVSEVAPALRRAGCRHFFVSSAAEAIELRQLIGPDSQIFVLQGFDDSELQAYLEHQLVPVIVSLPMFHRWHRAVGGRPNATCALKIDTGMNRFGVSPSELQALTAEPGLLEAAQVQWLMSHLACADAPAHPLNSKQLERFSAAGRSLKRRLPQLQLSLANSAGIFLAGAAHYDLVRPGISLYGGSPRADGSIAMKPVVQLQLPVVQVREIAVGESIGYGGECIARKPMVAVAVAGGYADGLLRSLAGAGHAWFHKSLPMLGRVSMDCCIYDVTHLAPFQRPSEGDLIEVLGPNISVDAMASAAGTISYEVLTRLGQRFSRHYI